MKKIKEIEILTGEQIASLPETVKENVTFLSKTISSESLATLNPLVTELLNLREKESELVLMPLNEKGEFNKENIKEFAGLKSSVRTYRASVKSSAKEMKLPYQKITKGLIAIEKTFVEEATKVLESAEAKFNPYLEDEKLKALERQKKKDKALLDKIEEEKSAREEIEKGLETTTVYNKIKYVLIAEAIQEKVSNAILNNNKESLILIKNDLESKTWENLIDSVNVSLLEDSLVLELKEKFNSTRRNSLSILEQRLSAIKIEEDNIALKSKQEFLETSPLKEDAKKIPSAPIGLKASTSKSNELINICNGIIQLLGENTGKILTTEVTAGLLSDITKVKLGIDSFSKDTK